MEKSTNLGIFNPGREGVQKAGNVFLGLAEDTIALEGLCDKNFFDGKMLAAEFLSYSYLADHLMLIPGRVVEGRGLSNGLSVCHIYAEKSGMKYAFNLGEKAENKLAFNAIPENIGFVFLRDASECFAFPLDIEGEKPVYKIADDVVMQVYFETEQFKGKRNRFYGCLARDTGSQLCLCNITADPRLGEILFRFFASEVQFE